MMYHFKLSNMIAGCLKVSSYGMHTKRHNGCDRCTCSTCYYHHSTYAFCVNKIDIVNGRRSYVSNLFGLLHQPIQLPCHAYVCGWCLKEWICVTVQLEVPLLLLSHQSSASRAQKQHVQLLCDIVMHCGTDVVASLQHTPLRSAQQATVNDSSTSCT